MGRTNTVARRTADDYSELPTIRGIDGALAFVHETLGVPWITYNGIRIASEKKRLKSFMINRGYSYAERDLYDWVMSMAQGGAE